MAGGDRQTGNGRRTELLPPSLSLDDNDVDDRVWRRLADLEYDHEQPGVAFFGGRLVVAGGFNQTFVEVMPVGQGQWTTIARMEFAEVQYTSFILTFHFRSQSAPLSISFFVLSSTLCIRVLTFSPHHM